MEKQPPGVPGLDTIAKASDVKVLAMLGLYHLSECIRIRKNPLEAALMETEIDLTGVAEVHGFHEYSCFFYSSSI